MLSILVPLIVKLIPRDKRMKINIIANEINKIIFDIFFGFLKKEYTERTKKIK